MCWKGYIQRKGLWAASSHMATLFNLIIFPNTCPHCATSLIPTRVPTCHAQLAGNLGLFDLPQAWDIHVSNSSTGEQTFEPEQLCVSMSPFHFFLMHKFTIRFLSTTRGSLSIWHCTSWLLWVVKSTRDFHQVVFLEQSLKEWFDIEYSDGNLNLCCSIYYLFWEKKTKTVKNV